MEPISEELFNSFASLIYKKTGIVLKENKKSMLRQRLRQRLTQLKINDFIEYWYRLGSDEFGHSELEYLIDAITTNETYFHRSLVHFGALRNRILPELVKRGHQVINIWSAGTATGEESYELAISAAEFIEEHPGVTIKILGTDVSSDILQRARRSEYADRRIGKLPQYIRDKYFDVIDPQDSFIPFAKKVIRVKSILKKMVTFKQHNLINDSYYDRMHVIFCRNVMIYFDENTRQKVIKDFRKSLVQGGYLIVGHAESMHMLESELKIERYENTTLYKNISGSFA